jgi:hypothetical protein
VQKAVNLNAVFKKVFPFFAKCAYVRTMLLDITFPSASNVLPSAFMARATIRTIVFIFRLLHVWWWRWAYFRFRPRLLYNYNYFTSRVGCVIEQLVKIDYCILCLIQYTGISRAAHFTTLVGGWDVTS